MAKHKELAGLLENHLDARANQAKSGQTTKHTVVRQMIPTAMLGGVVLSLDERSRQNRARKNHCFEYLIFARAAACLGIIYLSSSPRQSRIQTNTAQCVCLSRKSLVLRFSHDASQTHLEPMPDGTHWSPSIQTISVSVFAHMKFWPDNSKTFGS